MMNQYESCGCKADHLDFGQNGVNIFSFGMCFMWPLTLRSRGNSLGYVVRTCLPVCNAKVQALS